MLEAAKSSRPLYQAPAAIDPAVKFAEVTLPAAIAAGTIIDRGENFLADGYLCRYVYA
jgi:hypothetical protein